MARILLVEDDPDQLEIRQLVLETEHHAVRTAVSPAEAVESCQDAPPEVVIMDLRLPRFENGVALIRDLRRLAPELGLIVLSGWTDDLKQHPIRSEINHVLKKPARSRQLLGLVDQLTGKGEFAP